MPDVILKKKEDKIDDNVKCTLSLYKAENKKETRHKEEKSTSTINKRSFEIKKKNAVKSSECL